MTTADRLTKLTSQLVGDIGRLPGVTLDTAGEQQLIQLLTDAMEEVGHIALSDSYTPADSGYYDKFVTGRPAELEIGAKSCGCGPGQSCHTCVPLPGGITL